MDNSEVCFIDCETTGLDPTRHYVWEIGLIVDNQEYQWILELTSAELMAADIMALRIGDYYNRSQNPKLNAWGLMGNPYKGVVSKWNREEFAMYVTTLIGRRHLVGNVVSFDAQRIGEFLGNHGAPPIWHYHLVDTEAMAAGFLAVPPPWDSKELSKLLNIDPDDFDRHTALGDARWAKAMYETILDRSGNDTDAEMSGMQQGS